MRLGNIALRRPPPFHSTEIQQLLHLAGQGVDVSDWLIGAESSVEFLEDNVRADRVVLYASLPHVLIHGVLAPLKQLKKPNHKALEHDFVAPDAAWHIEHVSGGGRPDRVYLAPPLGNDNPTLKGGEKLVFRRSWPVGKRASTEISQRLVHALELHYVEERNAYCRLDEVGDIEEVIRIHYVPSERFGESVVVVTITGHIFYEYALLAGMGLVFFFDFTRYQPSSFNGWSNVKRFDRTEPHFFYHGGIQPGVGSYINGRQIVVPALTRREIAHRYKELRNPKKRRYASFKALSLKSGERIEVSCDPAKLSNYFQPESELPLEMSPAFFRAEVLHRYKADPSKYELTDRSINCRGAWHLRTYDVNEAGEVHTYLRYLAYLPYQEQLYWQSFNEWPKGSVSQRAFRTDFLGEWITDYDPLHAIKHKVARLDDLSPAWWNPRGPEVRGAVHCPVTGAVNEWAEAILALDQLVTEGFQEGHLKKMALELGRTLDDKWRSLKLVEQCLIGKGVAEDKARVAVNALRRIRDLRTIVKGHAAPRKREEAEKSAVTSYGSLRAHFDVIAADCDEALELVFSVMDAGQGLTAGFTPPLSNARGRTPPR